MTMRKRGLILVCVLTALFLAGCAAGEVSQEDIDTVLQRYEDVIQGDPLAQKVIEGLQAAGAGETEQPPAAEVASITLDPSSITVHTGDTFSVAASPVPANAADTTLRYSVSDGTVLSDDGNGQFTALKSGEAVITVSCGTDVSAECRVTVEYTGNGPEIFKISKKYKKDSKGLYWLRMTVHTTKDVSKVELYYYRDQSVYMTDYKPDERGDEYIWYVGYPVSEHGGYCKFRVTAYGVNGKTDSKSFEYRVPVLGHD